MLLAGDFRFVVSPDRRSLPVPVRSPQNVAGGGQLRTLIATVSSRRRKPE